MNPVHLFRGEKYIANLFGHHAKCVIPNERMYQTTCNVSLIEYKEMNLIPDTAPIEGPAHDLNH